MPNTSSAPRISVVVPTHDRPDDLPHAVASALMQPEADEVVVVDDSPAASVADQLASMGDSRVRVIRNPAPHGAAAARNRGIRSARGEVVAFLDDDDRLRPRALQHIAQAFDAQPALRWCWGGRRWIDETDAEIQVDRATEAVVGEGVSDPAAWLVAARAATSAGFAARRQLLLDLGGFDESLVVSEDRDLVYRLCATGAVGRRLPETLVDHRVHSGSRLSDPAAFDRQRASEQRVIDKNLAFLQAHPHVFAMHLHRVASKQRQAGDRDGANATVREILSVRRTDMKAWRRRLTW